MQLARGERQARVHLDQRLVHGRAVVEVHQTRPVVGTGHGQQLVAQHVGRRRTRDALRRARCRPARPARRRGRPSPPGRAGGEGVGLDGRGQVALDLVDRPLDVDAGGRAPGGQPARNRSAAWSSIVPYCRVRSTAMAACSGSAALSCPALTSSSAWTPSSWSDAISARRRSVPRIASSSSCTSRSSVLRSTSSDRRHRRHRGGLAHAERRRPGTQVGPHVAVGARPRPTGRRLGRRSDGRPGRWRRAGSPPAGLPSTRPRGAHRRAGVSVGCRHPTMLPHRRGRARAGDAPQHVVGPATGRIENPSGWRPST